MVIIMIFVNSLFKLCFIAAHLLVRNSWKVEKRASGESSKEDLIDALKILVEKEKLIIQKEFQKITHSIIWFSVHRDDLCSASPNRFEA